MFRAETSVIHRHRQPRASSCRSRIAVSQPRPDFSNLVCLTRNIRFRPCGSTPITLDDAACEYLHLLVQPRVFPGPVPFRGFVPPMIPERRQLRFLEVQEKREQLVDDFTPHPDHLRSIETGHALPRDDPTLSVHHHPRRNSRPPWSPGALPPRVLPASSPRRIAAPSFSPCWPRPAAPFFR